MSAAVLPAPASVYREEQFFGWWVYALLAAMMVVGGAGLAWGGAPGAKPRVMIVEIPLISAVGVLLPAVLIVGVLRMTTEVRPDRVRVWFGWVPCYRRDVPVDAIASIEVVSYRPLADFGGWGVRIGRSGERALNARGDRGVRLILTDGSRLLIGSQKPEALAVAIDKALHPSV